MGDIQNAGTTTNNGIIQGTVTGAGTTTNNGGITQGGNSLQVSSLDALQKVINESVGKTEAVVINLAGNITGDLTVPVNANVTIDGDSKYTIKGTVNCETSTTSADVTNLTLQNLTMDGESSKNWAVISQNQGTKNGEGEIELTGVNSLNLTMNNCTVQNYVKKALYLTNAKKPDYFPAVLLRTMPPVRWGIPTFPEITPST